MDYRQHKLNYLLAVSCILASSALAGDAAFPREIFGRHPDPVTHPGWRGRAALPQAKGTK